LFAAILLFPKMCIRLTRQALRDTRACLVDKLYHMHMVPN
jgi:hypothetical protein